MPFFQPYWKTHRRNERGDRGNVGIIRSPISILPDLSGHERAYFAVMQMLLLPLSLCWFDPLECLIPSPGAR
jgi:hypothetical protein